MYNWDINFRWIYFPFYSFVIRDNRRLFETVQTDFADKYPDYQFIDCSIGEGDLVVAYIHLKFKKPGDDKIQEEVWKYWDTTIAWLHRDKYLELMEERKMNEARVKTKQ